MDNEMYKKIADDISDQMISLYKNNKTKNKNIIDLYKELLDEKYKKYQTEILTYIAESLSIKGYVIENSDNFELRKY